MARKHEAVGHLQAGCSPSEIAEKMGISVASVMQYLYTQVGEGQILRSDIVLSIDESTRAAVEEAVDEAIIADRATVVGELKGTRGIDLDDAAAYFDLRDSKVALGDLYYYIYSIETLLHGMIKDVLKLEHGEKWWRKGIPVNVRRDCADAFQVDSEPAEDEYCYTTVIHLKQILEKQWNLFAKFLPSSITDQKKSFLSSLNRLNQIRNRVMHPSKGVLPSQDDFYFVGDLAQQLDQAKFDSNLKQLHFQLEKMRQITR